MQGHTGLFWEILCWEEWYLRPWNFLLPRRQQQLRILMRKDSWSSGLETQSASTYKLRTKSGETNKVRYRRFGAFHNDPGETIDVTSRIYELELLLNGTIVWRRESVQSAPMHLQLKDGETIRAAVDRVLKPKGVNFKGRLPSYVVRPEHRKPLGTSRLSLGS